MRPDIPFAYCFGSYGETWGGGNRCFLPSRLYALDDPSQVVGISLEVFLSHHYPAYTRLFTSYDYTHVPSPHVLKDELLKDVQAFAHVPKKTLYCIQIANLLLSEEVDPLKRMALYRYKLCFVPHLLRLQSKSVLNRATVLTPNFSNAIHTGILPIIPFHLTKLMVDNGNDYYSGQHITHLGLWGLIIEYCFNKVLRQTCKKRRRATIWKALIRAYPTLWPLMVDIILLYVFLGVYDHQPSYPTPFLVPLDVAAALAVFARYMLTFSADEACAWVDENENLMILGWCAYIYDQVDASRDLFLLFTKFYNHTPYNEKLKKALIDVRAFFASFVSSFVVLHFNGVDFQNAEMIGQWHNAFKRADAMCDEWYTDTKNSKYSPTISCYQIYGMLKQYYCTKWNLKRKEHPELYVGEKKCFIPIHEDRYPWLIQLAIWTVKRHSNIPQYNLLGLLGFPSSLIILLNNIPCILMTQVSWKKTTVDNMDFELDAYYDYLPDVIAYTYLCYALGEIKITVLPPALAEKQKQKVQAKSLLLLSLDKIDECTHLRLCRSCIKPKNTVTVAAAGADSPFINLASVPMPAIERKSVDTGAFRRHNEFGSLKKNNVRIEDGHMSCGATSIIKNTFHANPLCGEEVLKIRLDGYSIQLPENIHMSICSFGCGNRAQYNRRSIIDGQIACCNCTIRVEPKIQMLLGMTYLDTPPHFFCNIEGCGNESTSFFKILDDATLSFCILSLCDMHNRSFCAKTSRLILRSEVASSIVMATWNAYSNRQLEKMDRNRELTFF